MESIEISGKGLNLKPGSDGSLKTSTRERSLWRGGWDVANAKFQFLTRNSHAVPSLVPKANFIPLTGGRCWKRYVWRIGDARLKCCPWPPRDDHQPN